MLKRHALPTLAAVLALSPSIAFAAQRMLTPAGVFADAAPFPKILMIALLAAIVVAVVVTVRRLTAGPALHGGSAFVSNLRLGGPLFGLLGASYGALYGAIGVANFNPPDMRVIAPGVAECLLLLGLGMLAGAVAVVAHWAIEARIDRAVLRN